MQGGPLEKKIMKKSLTIVNLNLHGGSGGIRTHMDGGFKPPAYASSATLPKLAEDGGIEPHGVTRPWFSGPVAGHSAASSNHGGEPGSRTQFCLSAVGALAVRWLTVCLALRSW